MTLKTVLSIMLTVTAAGAAFSAAAQSVPSVCDPYIQVVESSTANVPAVIPDALLDNGKALACLASIVSSFNTGSGAEQLSQVKMSKMLSATAGLRSLMSRRASSTPPNTSDSMLKEFIGNFRRSDNLDVITALSYAAVSDNSDLRVNSTLILANVIDNSSVYVPLIILNDKNLANTDYGVKGRANLLVVVSVVAPWAYQENYESISRTMQFVSSTIGNDDPNFVGTRNILSNIKARLSSQTDNSNKSVRMTDDWKHNCARYVQTVGRNIVNRNNLTYTNE